MENLTKKNFFAYAVRMYNNPSCSGPAEFDEDLLRIKYIKRLLHKYARTGEISPRLLVNHLIGICNVFHAEAVARMLFFRVHSDAWPALKTSLEYVNLMPEIVPVIDGTMIVGSSIKRDEKLLALLIEAISAKEAK